MIYEKDVQMGRNILLPLPGVIDSLSDWYADQYNIMAT